MEIVVLASTSGATSLVAVAVYAIAILAAVSF
jgi:hypothetical protein